MAQVHNRVNAGIMDAVTCGGMCEAAEPEDEEYEIGMEEEGGPEPYAHVVKESSDVVPYLNLDLHNSEAYPFITFIKKDGSDTETFVGAAGEMHNTMPAALLSNHGINREDFESLWDIKRNEYKSGRIWLLDDMVVVSFYSYARDNYSQMYKDITRTLLVVKEKLNADFNVGKVVVDFWTFLRGHDNIFVPVRWLTNGIADAYFKYMTKCIPVGDDCFRMTTDKGLFEFDWKGDEIESEYSMLRESKEIIKINESDLKKIINEIVKKIVVI